jgi:rhodanese-related sulfurtransferase
MRIKPAHAPPPLRKLMHDGAILLDVRTHYEHAGYHLNGAINIPYDELDCLKNVIQQWDKPIITFSSYGRRSKIAAKKLQEFGMSAFDGGSIQEIENEMEEVEPI